jgi:hypothetical protein
MLAPKVLTTMRGWLVLLLGFSLAACTDGEGEDASGDGDTTPASDGSEDGWTGGGETDLMLGSIDVRVEYEGAAAGSLTIGAFPECPPVNPPVSFKRIDESMYPVETTLVDIEAGNWCVYAFIDLPPENPTFPAEEDPQGFTEQVPLMGDTASVPLTVTDP